MSIRLSVSFDINWPKSPLQKIFLLVFLLHFIHTKNLCKMHSTLLFHFLFPRDFLYQFPFLQSSIIRDFSSAHDLLFKCFPFICTLTFQSNQLPQNKNSFLNLFYFNTILTTYIEIFLRLCFRSLCILKIDNLINRDAHLLTVVEKVIT